MVPICIRIVPSYGTPLQSCSNFKKKKIRNELLYQLYARVGNEEIAVSSSAVPKSLNTPSKSYTLGGLIPRIAI